MPLQLPDSDLYVGLAGIDLGGGTYCLGDGITVAPTYAHLFAPMLIHFERPAAGRKFPSFIQSASGGFSYDIEALLHIPAACDPGRENARVDLIWWLVALLRLRGFPSLTAPVLSAVPFSAITADGEPRLWSMEVTPWRILGAKSLSQEHVPQVMDWVAGIWRPGLDLLNASEDFDVAFRALDHSMWTPTFSLGLLSLWAALERLFSPSRMELCFRIPAAIATYLEPPGETRFARYKAIKKLYDARSSIAHGRSQEVAAEYAATYVLLRDCLARMLDSHAVPERPQLEAQLFGCPRTADQKNSPDKTPDGTR